MYLTDFLCNKSLKKKSLTGVRTKLRPKGRWRNGVRNDLKTLKLRNCRSRWPRGLRYSSAVACLLRLWVRIPLGAWMSVCNVCCVLSGSGLCDELNTRPESSGEKGRSNVNKLCFSFLSLLFFVLSLFLLTLSFRFLYVSPSCTRRRSAISGPLHV